MTSNIDGYTLEKTLGKGIYAEVKLASQPDGTPVALKIYNT